MDVEDNKGTWCKLACPAPDCFLLQTATLCLSIANNKWICKLTFFLI